MPPVPARDRRLTSRRPIARVPCSTHGGPFSRATGCPDIPQYGPAGAARAGPYCGISGQPVALEKGPPWVEHGTRAIGRREVNLRSRAGTGGISRGGILVYYR